MSDEAPANWHFSDLLLKHGLSQIADGQCLFIFGWKKSELHIYNEAVSQDAQYFFEYRNTIYHVEQNWSDSEWKRV